MSLRSGMQQRTTERIAKDVSETVRENKTCLSCDIDGRTMYRSPMIDATCILEEVGK